MRELCHDASTPAEIPRLERCTYQEDTNAHGYSSISHPIFA